jgi:hypothetical protein
VSALSNKVAGRERERRKWRVERRRREPSVRRRWVELGVLEARYERRGVFKRARHQPHGTCSPPRRGNLSL